MILSNALTINPVEITELRTAKMGGKLYRSLTRWARTPLYEHSSLEGFCDGELLNGIHSIAAGPAPIEVMVNGKVGAPLIICLDGNAPRGENRNPPFFSGFGVIPKDFPISHVAVSDPTLALSEDITLAWYAGAEGLPLQQTLPLVFRHIIERLKPRSVWFFGGSGGGFASIYYASKVPNSAALVWNPQTDILEYNPAHVLKYAQTAFGCGGDQEVRSVLSENVETQLSPNCKIIYLQNSTDWHVKRHLNPLLERMGLSPRTDMFSGLVNDKFYLHIGAWGTGHAVPPKPALTSMLKAILPATNDLFADNGVHIKAAIDEAFTQID